MKKTLLSIVVLLLVVVQTANAKVTTDDPTPPVNDMCSGAITLPVNITLTCVETVSATLANAQNAVYQPECSAGINDVWFKFTATSSIHHLTFKNLANTTDTALKVNLYAGSDCNSINLWNCYTGNSILTEMVPGQQYYIQVSSASNVQPVMTTFDICISTPILATNDECSGAIELPINTSYGNQLFETASLSGATYSQVSQVCSFGSNADVWFKFTAPTTALTINIYDRSWTTSETPPNFVLYKGGCSSLTQVYCGNQARRVNLTVGQEYFVRVSHTHDLAGEQGATFKIAIKLHSNEDCSGAITLPINNGPEPVEFVTGSLEGASIPQGQNVTTADLYYQFTATSTTHSIKATGNNTLYMSVYSGTCANISLVKHIGLGYTLTNLTVGQTYILRVYGDNIDTSPYQISITTPLLCSDAQPFVSGYTAYVFPNTNTADMGPMGCLTFTPNTSWFTMTIDTPGTLNFQITQNTLFNNFGTATGQPLDADYIVYGPFTDSASICNNLIPTNIHSCSFSTSAVENFTINSQAEGEIYLIVITNFDEVSGFIKFEQTGGTGTLAVEAPDGAVTQDFAPGATLADLNIEGQNIQWYDNPGQSAGRSVNMMNLDTPLPLTTVLVDGTTYYASQTIYGIESVNRLPVTVSAVLGTKDSALNNLRSYPNPTRDIFTISNSEKIDFVEIYSVTGQLIKNDSFNSETITINLEDMQAGIYMVKVNSGNAEKTIKLVKQ